MQYYKKRCKGFILFVRLQLESPFHDVRPLYVCDPSCLSSNKRPFRAQLNWPAVVLLCTVSTRSFGQNTMLYVLPAYLPPKETGWGGG